jgi:putative transposase
MFAHLVWGTKRRRPLITVDVEQGIYRAIEAKCFELGCAPRAIGGTAEHVHRLSRIHPSISIARLAAEIKGSSSYFVTQRLGTGFQWQKGYAAFSVSADDVPAVEPMSSTRNATRLSAPSKPCSNQTDSSQTAS